eukprot:TRINITY_DN20743_c0_g2_i1.p1 TRINITY_DN20743_c0_g2~~TRINITY_DN20743_c0_g2_i1.p1  ORF type:complete len:500 (+),score=159.83 TRINITY_DN20743_c0_g2_i1:127-1500(+)
MIEPVLTPCLHRFCLPCLRKSLALRPECPLCRQAVNPLLIHNSPVSEQTAAVTQSLIAYCDNRANDCTWMGPALELPSHAEHCEFEVVACGYPQCEVKAIRRVLQEHREFCERRPVTCVHCLNPDIPCCEYDSHIELLCTEIPIECANGCGVEGLTRSQRAEHNAECEYAEVSCPFEIHGCGIGLLRRRDLAGHLQEAAISHTLILCEKVGKQDEVIMQQRLHINKLLRRSLIVIDKSGRGTFTTIAEGLEHAEDGDRIQVKEGVYRECLVLSKKVCLEADGKVVVENGREFNVVVIKEACRLQGFTLRQRSKSFFCIRIVSVSEETVVEHCDIKSDHFSCVQVDSHTNPLIQRNVIHDSLQCGILIKAWGKGRIMHNVIHSNCLSNVYADQGAAPVVHYNEIHSSRQHGVWVKPQSTADISHNVIYHNNMEDIKVEDGAEPSLVGNTFQRAHAIHR